MGPIAVTPRTQPPRRPGRPSRHPSTAPEGERPHKKLRYIPGGPGGGGRYLDPDTGLETPVGGTGPGGYNYVGPRGRVGRENAARGVVPPAVTSPTTTYSRPRRERPPPSASRATSTSASAAAAAQSEGYKPREERSWEEFHQDLDIEIPLAVFGAHEVDGTTPPSTKPHTPLKGEQSQVALDGNDGQDGMLVDSRSLSLQAEESVDAGQDVDASNVGHIEEVPQTPRRRPGRPVRRLDSMLSGLGSPPAPRILPVPSHNPKEKLNLPKPSYREINTFATYEEHRSVNINYVDKSMASLGYQESDLFHIPEKQLIRLPEGAIEEDLDLAVALKAERGDAPAVGRVEYDMDEQDSKWLDYYNGVRKKELSVEGIKPAIFEITMTQIEKEWHALEKRIPKPNPKPPQTHRPRSSSAVAQNGDPGQGEEQDTKCAICDDGDCENTNAIVFCDGCDLAVHQECYGVPFIPEGQWLCRKCQLIGRGTATCIFCPNMDGAFKQTSNARWSHLLCALWIPEVNLGNTTFMEPVMDVEKVPKQRWKLNCYICEQRMGACIQCGNKQCYEAFHVTCARRARLFLKMKSAHGGPSSIDASVLKAFCTKHVPADWRRENDVDRALRQAQRFYRKEHKNRLWGDSQQSALSVSTSQTVIPSVALEDPTQEDELAISSNKRKRDQPQKQIWRLPSGAPIVPQVVYQNVDTALGRFAIRKRKEYIAEACKYWTLKREARRGAALLKRLQLQMESFSSMEITRRNFAGMGAAGRPRLARRIEFADMLQEDMAQIKKMCLMVKEREAQKLKDVQLLRDIVDIVYFPINRLLEPILAVARKGDSKDFFTEGLNEVERRLKQRYYSSVAAFSGDILAVFSAAVGLDSNSDVKEMHEQLSGSDPTMRALKGEPKEMRIFARRIIKKIQGPLQDAARKEADLGGKPYEEKLAALDALINNSVATRKGSISSTAGQVLDVTDDEADNAQDTERGPVDSTNGHAHENDVANGVHDEEQDLASGEQDVDHMYRINGSGANEKSDDAVIRLKTDSGETVPIGNIDPHLTDVSSGKSIDGAPALSSSDSTNPSTSHPEPLTPPRSEKDLLAPLQHGGVPWYFEPFDPVGTTIHEERWTGKEVLRGMSEELSELDDDELDGLVDKEDMNALQATTDNNMVDVDEITKKKALKAARERARRRKNKY